jgi:hypothetical protein
MRFSAIFQRPLPSQPARRQLLPCAEPSDAASSPAEPDPSGVAPPSVPVPEVSTPASLPEDLDLDARVRLLGEWQLGEA